MNIEKHHLIHDLPEHQESIHELKEKDAHFLKQFNEYHDITHEIYSIENNDIDVSDEHFNSLKLQRVHLKDTLHKTILDYEK